jgi:hypothetical protein
VRTSGVVEDLEVGPLHEELLQVDEHVLLLHGVVERAAALGPLGADTGVDRLLNISALVAKRGGGNISVTSRRRAQQADQHTLSQRFATVSKRRQFGVCSKISSELEMYICESGIQ